MPATSTDRPLNVTKEIHHVPSQHPHRRNVRRSLQATAGRRQAVARRGAQPDEVGRPQPGCTGDCGTPVLQISKGLLI